MSPIFYYFLIINILSGSLFAFDKLAAIKGKRRIPEIRLHLFELSGGIFANVLLMYLLRHKNRKISYYGVSFLLALLWIGASIAYYKLKFSNE